MRDGSEGGVPRPLPREWLPDPHPPDEAPEWEAKVERIMSAADPELRKLGRRSALADAASWAAMGRWWKPAAAASAAAMVLLLLTGRPPASPQPPQESLSLGLIAAEGDPVALWEAFEIQADPVLARIAFQGLGGVTGQGMTSTAPEGENR